MESTTNSLTCEVSEGALQKLRERDYNYGCPAICAHWVTDDCAVCDMAEDCRCKGCGCAECTLDARVSCTTCAKAGQRCSIASKIFDK